MMIPRSRHAVKLLTPLAESCPHLTRIDRALKVAIVLGMVAGAYFVDWLTSSHVRLFFWGR